VRGWPDDAGGASPRTGELEELIVQGTYGDTAGALNRLDQLLPGLEHTPEPDALLVGLYGRAVLLRQAGAPPADTADACDLLERAAQERRNPLWTALACAVRANARLDGGDVGTAVADLARVDLDHLTADLTGRPGHLLLDALASSYARLRLHDRVDEARAALEAAIERRSPADRAVHWTHWSTELATRALEPLAGGAPEPTSGCWNAPCRSPNVWTSSARPLPPGCAGAPRASAPWPLPTAAGPATPCGCSGTTPTPRARDLPPLERQMCTLAAMHAHTRSPGR
jgi:hypothetical protein